MVNMKMNTKHVKHVTANVKNVQKLPSNVPNVPLKEFRVLNQIVVVQLANMKRTVFA